MDRKEIWMKDPELRAAYEALGPTFRREVEKAQQRRTERGGVRAVAAAQRGATRTVVVRR